MCHKIFNIYESTQIIDSVAGVAGNVPVEAIENALKLIRVSKLEPGDPNFGVKARNRGPSAA